MSPAARLLTLAGPAAAGPAAAQRLGAKAAMLAAAHRAGLPAVAGWVVPVSESLPAVRAATAAMSSAGLPAGRRAVLRLPVDPGLAGELREAAVSLGGRVIVRSSSPLEDAPRWSGAFSSVAEVGPDDVAAAVRSCWAAAFAVDPLERLAACGLPLTALALGLIIQPELRPDAGGVAWVNGEQVTVEGVPGHPGALLSGWAEGARAELGLREAARPQVISDSGLAGLLGQEPLAAVAGLARRVRVALGDDMIEWAVADGTAWLLQSGNRAAGTAARAAAGPAGRAAAGQPAAVPGPERAQPAPAGLADPAGLTARERMPLLAALTQQRGQHVRARPAAPGTAAGRLVACRPHEPPGPACRDAILLIGRPLPAFAPLLFGARGVIARAGAAGSHLAEVARSLGVPMVTGCQPEAVLGPAAPGQEWIAAIDGAAGDVALLPALAIGRE